MRRGEIESIYQGSLREEVGPQSSKDRLDEAQAVNDGHRDALLLRAAGYLGRGRFGDERMPGDGVDNPTRAPTELENLIHDLGVHIFEALVLFI
jgi:hypothetical protein